MLKLHSSKTLDFYSVFGATESPLSGSGAEDPQGRVENLAQSLIKNPPATFLGHVKGNYMIDADINDGDWLIIDKSIEPQNEQLALAFIDGEFLAKKIKIEDNRCWLITANGNREVLSDNQVMIWGIVLHVIKSV